MTLINPPIRKRVGPGARRRHGFTLTELLIVIGIITLVAILAVPAFRTLTGARSTESAQNQLSAFLGHARADAIALQTIQGVAFFRDNETQRVKGIMVRQAQTPSVLPMNTTGTVDVFLDAVPDRDPILLPMNVGLQVADAAAVTIPATPPGQQPNPANNTRGDDAYLGFNTHNAPVNGMEPFTYGGVILFDGYGRLVNKRYGFKFYTETPLPNGTIVKNYSEMAKLYELTVAANTLVDFVPPVITGQAGSVPLRSAVGFVLYDEGTFKELGHDDGDPQIYNPAPGEMYNDNAATRTAEAVEERWLDANGTPVLVNRGNGTLVRGGSQ